MSPRHIRRRRPAHADARLLELIARFYRVNRQVDALWNREHTSPDWRAEELRIRPASDALVMQGWEIRAAIAAIPAHTAAGLAAKASLAAWETCDGCPEDGPPAHSDAQVAWSLAVDVLRGIAA